MNASHQPFAPCILTWTVSYNYIVIHNGLRKITHCFQYVISDILILKKRTTLEIRGYIYVGVLSSPNCRCVCISLSVILIEIILYFNVHLLSCINPVVISVTRIVCPPYPYQIYL